MSNDFNAFIGTDLFSQSNLRIGDTIALNATANVNLSVSDDDDFLSGDIDRNGRSDDRSEQTAVVTFSGNSYSVGRVSIERVFTLEDENGNRFELIGVDIESLGGPDNTDFYTFSGARPAAGATLSVVGIRNAGAEEIAFSSLGADPVTPPQPPVDGVRQVIDFENASSGDSAGFPGVTISAQRRVEINDEFTIQAEDLASDDFYTVRGRRAEGGELVRLGGRDSGGELSTTFGGDTGTYDISLRLQDERDGQSEIDVVVDGVIVGTVVLDNDNNGGGSNNGRFSDFTLEGIDIPQGAEITFVARRDGGEFVRFDSVTFSRDETLLENASALIFDTDNPTGGDTDLTNGDGNILIISEDDDASDPDDNRDGGVITFDFETPSFIESLDVIDVEESGEVRLFDADGNLISTIVIPAGANNSVQTLNFNVDGVARVEVDLAGSGAVDNLAFVTPDTTPDNSAPTVGTPLTGTVSGDGGVVSINLLEGASDADGDTLTVVNLMGLGDGITFDGTGTVSVDPSDDAFISLAEGETQDISLSFEIVDEDGGSVDQTATITITGTNDDPTVTGVLTADGDADGVVISIDLLDGASDVDNGAVLSVENVLPLPDGVTLDGTTLIVDPTDESFDSLAEDEELDIVVGFDVVDENGGSVEQTATITITGTNDAPTVTGVLTADGVADGAGFSIDLLDGASDVDNGAVLDVENVTGLVPGVTLDGTTLNVDPTDTSFDALAEGETTDIVVSFDVVDENGGSVEQTATITITGTNDAPVATDFTFSINEDGGLGTALPISDVDGDILSFEVLDGPENGQSAFIDGGAGLTYDPADNFNGTDSFTYAVSDGNGGSSTATVTINVAPENDAPVVAAALTAAANEDDAAITLDLLEGASDVDNGAILSIENVSTLPAGVTLNGNTLTVDPTNAAFQSLACLLYTSPSPRDRQKSRMPSSA